MFFYHNMFWVRVPISNLDVENQNFSFFESLALEKIHIHVWVKVLLTLYPRAWNSITPSLLQVSKNDNEKVRFLKSFGISQGLLYLDGRNSQKYIHQDQADF